MAAIAERKAFAKLRIAFPLSGCLVHLPGSNGAPHHLRPADARGIPNRGNAMRSFANAFLSAIAAATISGTLFSVVLI